MGAVRSTACVALFLLTTVSCDSGRVESVASESDAVEEQETVEDRKVGISNETREPPDVVAHSDRYDLEGRMIDVGRGRLFLIEEGEGVPIVLLNGGPGNSLQSFIPHFSRAAEFARVIYYDPRGVGRSDREPGGERFTTQQAIADLDRLRSRLAIDAWIVLGWSWGGLLAQRYALEHPERVLGLVLVASSESMGLELEDDTYVDHLSGEERRKIRSVYTVGGESVVPRVTDELDADAVRSLVYNGYLNGDWKRQFYYRPSDERMAHIAQHEWVHAPHYNAQMGETSFDRDLTGAFQEFSKPVMLVYGAWDMTFSREMPARLAAQFPESELHVFERSSHNPFASEPERFFKLLERFVDGVR